MLGVTEMKVRLTLEMGLFLRRDDWMKKDSVGQISRQWSFHTSGSQLLPLWLQVIVSHEWSLTALLRQQLSHCLQTPACSIPGSGRGMSQQVGMQKARPKSKWVANLARAQEEVGEAWVQVGSVGLRPEKKRALKVASPHQRSQDLVG